MVEHNGSFNKKDFVIDNSKGRTSRSWRESFRNIKTVEKARAIVGRRNPKEIIVAKYNEQVIFPIK
jgi:hypothetical protein